MTAAKPLFVPYPAQGHAEAGEIHLRDGLVASIRCSEPSDESAMRDFFLRLSPESRHKRFLSCADPPDSWFKTICDSSNPKRGLTLIASHCDGESQRIIGVGTYLAKDASTAEVAFSVDDVFQGMFIGTLLLERLAALAVENGITRFWAVTQAFNRPMLDIFEKSGFEMRKVLEGGYFEIVLSLSKPKC